MSASITRGDFARRLLEQADTIAAIGRDMIPRDRYDVDDLIQEVFLRAWANQDSLRDSSKLPQWVATIARNTARDWGRRSGSAPAGSLEDAPHGAASALESMQEAERWAELLDALESLDEIDRRLLVARYAEDAPYTELQAQSGFSYAALTTRIHRAKRMLRRALGHATALGFALLPPRRSRAFGHAPIHTGGSGAMVSIIAAVSVAFIGGIALTYHRDTSVPTADTGVVVPTGMLGSTSVDPAARASRSDRETLGVIAARSRANEAALRSYETAFTLRKTYHPSKNRALSSLRYWEDTMRKGAGFSPAALERALAVLRANVEDPSRGAKEIRAEGVFWEDNDRQAGEWAEWEVLTEPGASRDTAWRYTTTDQNAPVIEVFSRRSGEVLGRSPWDGLSTLPDGLTNHDRSRSGVRERKRRVTDGKTSSDARYSPYGTVDGLLTESGEGFRGEEFRLRRWSRFSGAPIANFLAGDFMDDVTTELTSITLTDELVGGERCHRIRAVCSVSGGAPDATETVEARIDVELLINPERGYLPQEIITHTPGTRTVARADIRLHESGLWIPVSGRSYTYIELDGEEELSDETSVEFLDIRLNPEISMDTWTASELPTAPGNAFTTDAHIDGVAPPAANAPWAVRMRYVEALWNIAGFDRASMVRPLLDVMREEPSVRWEAANLLRSGLSVDPLGASAATPRLLDSLIGGVRQESEEAARILWTLPDTTVPALVDYLQTSESPWQVRLRVIHVLWAIPEFDRSIVAPIIEEAVRELRLSLDEIQHAMRLLEGVKDYDRLRVADVFVAPLLSTPANWEARIRYLELLWDIPGFDRASVLDILLEGISSNDGGVASICAQKILGISPLSADAAPALREGLNHEDAAARIWIRQAHSKL